MNHSGLWMMITEILVLTYRNLVASIDKVFLIWQIIFPIFYIFISGYAYSALLGNQGIRVGEILVSYPSFLAVGMIGFNVMNNRTLAGSIIWTDKRNGMFQQILVMPFTKVQYIFSNLVTIMLMGLTSASLILIIGLPTGLWECSPYFMEHTVYSVCHYHRGDSFWIVYRHNFNKVKE